MSTNIATAVCLVQIPVVVDRGVSCLVVIAAEYGQGSAADPERFFVPPYVGHRGWLGIRLDVPGDWDEIAHLVADAYRIVAPKRLLAESDNPSHSGFVS